MQPSDLARADWSRLSELIADAMALHFPRERWSELQHRVTRAAADFGFADVAACVDWLVSAPLSKPQIEVLARHLTVGETYFFRENKTLEVFARTLLPDLVRARRQQGRRLRLWSAACCSGEEAYSLAILLRENLPEIAAWDVTILATDINAGFLAEAAVASYSARACRHVPDELKERYFTRTADGGYAVVPSIRKMVTFARMNLATDDYPSRATGTEAMDFIFCRNVLIYFTPAHIRRVAAGFHRSLVDGGWLAVSPSEASAASFPQFAVANFPGVILFQKRTDPFKVRPGSPPSPRGMEWTQTATVVAPPRPPPQTLPAPAPAPETMAAPIAPHAGAQARTLANQGRPAEALPWCDRWIAADKLDSSAHYLRAVILLELADRPQARRSFQRAIYLQPDLVLAHYALGTLARGLGEREQAIRHFANARHLLARLRPADLLPESDGLTAGRLAETMTAAAALEAGPR